MHVDVGNVPGVFGLQSIFFLIEMKFHGAGPERFFNGFANLDGGIKELFSYCTWNTEDVIVMLFGADKGVAGT